MRLLRRCQEGGFAAPKGNLLSVCERILVAAIERAFSTAKLSQVCDFWPGSTVAQAIASKNKLSCLITAGHNQSIFCILQPKKAV